MSEHDRGPFRYYGWVDDGYPVRAMGGDLPFSDKPLLFVLDPGAAVSVPADRPAPMVGLVEWLRAAADDASEAPDQQAYLNAAADEVSAYRKEFLHGT